MPLIDTAMVERACVAHDGPDWRTFNASLWPQMRACLIAALPGAPVIASEDGR
jgi:hypothetical protein